MADARSNLAPPLDRGSPARRCLRIGIDATCLGSRRGYGRFLSELLPPLLDGDGGHEFVLFLDRWTAAGVDLPRARMVILDTSASQADAASARGNRSLSDLWTMGRAVAGARLDVMFFPSVYSYFPVPGRVPLVIAFHDAIAERHGRIVFPGRRTRWLWNAKVTLARLQAHAVLTVSEWSRRALHEVLGIALEKIHVAVEAPAAVFQPVTDDQPRRAWFRARSIPDEPPYLLYVGGFNPHKNVAALVRTFAGLEASGEGQLPHLVLVGDHQGDTFHSEVEELRSEIARLAVAGRVHWTGFVPDPELRHLYAGACALVLPSLEEGFGLPAVEAAACGTPSVATVKSPLPELLSGGGLFVEPDDPRMLGEALRVMLGSPARRAELAARALECARRLNWRATADATLRVLEDAAGAAS